MWYPKCIRKRPSVCGRRPPQLLPSRMMMIIIITTIIIICFKTRKLHCSQFIINIHQPTTPTTTVSDAATLQTFTEFSALGHLQGHIIIIIIIIIIMAAVVAAAVVAAAATTTTTMMITKYEQRGHISLIKNYT